LFAGLRSQDRREALGLDPQGHGLASSPVVDGELVLVGFDRALALRLRPVRRPTSPALPAPRNRTFGRRASRPQVSIFS